MPENWKRYVCIRKPMGFARTSLALVNLRFGKTMDEGEGSVDEVFLIPG